MKIAVLGATGNLGTEVVNEALTAGHTVLAYARRPEAITPRPGLEVVGGQLDDVDALSAALAGSETLIVSVTGPMKDHTFCRRTLPGILTAAQRAGVNHLVLVSAFGAGDTAGKASLGARLLYRTVLRGFFDDKAAGEELLATAGLAATVVFPVNLKQAPSGAGAAVEPLENVARVPGLPTLPFVDAARALVSVATDPETTGRRLLITTQKGWRARG